MTLTPFFIKPFKSFTALAAGLLLASTGSFAAEAKLRATGSYSELGKAQFLVGVYTEKEFESANELILSEQEKAIEVRVLAPKIYARRFRRMWQEGAAINTSLDEFRAHSKNMVDFGQFLQINFDQNDIFLMERLADGSLKVSLNEVELGQINDTDFFDILLRVLLGPVPISHELKESLLATDKLSPQEIAAFNSVAPKPERKYAINTIISAKESEELARIEMDINQPAVAAKPKPKPAPKKQAESKPKEKAPVKVAKATPPKKEAPKKELSIFEQVALDNKNREKKQPAGASVNLDMLGQEKASTNSASSTNKQIATQQVAKRALNEADVSGVFSSSERIAYLIARKGYFSAVVDKISRTVNSQRSDLQIASAEKNKTIIRVTISVLKGGEIEDLKVLNPSSDNKVNEAAKLAVYDSMPLPAFPDTISDQMLDMTIPIAVDDAYIRALNSAGRI